MPEAYLATFDFARNLIAACETFRMDVLDGATVDEAKEKVHYQETLAIEDEEGDPDEGDPLPEAEPRPYAIVIDGRRNTKRAGVGEWAGEGQVALVFEVLVPAEYKFDRQQDDFGVLRQKFRDRKRWAMALVGRLEDELTTLSGGADEEGNLYLNVHDIDLMTPPADPAEAEAEDYIGFAFLVTWK